MDALFQEGSRLRSTSQPWAFLSARGLPKGRLVNSVDAALELRGAKKKVRLQRKPLVCGSRFLMAINASLPLRGNLKAASGRTHSKDRKTDHK